MPGMEVPIFKIRRAIGFLQRSGENDYASAVWDLLDNYIAVNPEVLNVKYATETKINLDRPSVSTSPSDSFGNFGDPIQDVTAVGTPEPGWGAHAKDRPKAPTSGCAASSFHPGMADCPNLASGYLVRVNTKSKLNDSYPMCRNHGEMFEREKYVEWVQTFFGDEETPLSTGGTIKRFT